jgi:hypothetical protein
MSDLSNDTKKYTMKPRETIPLSLNLYCLDKDPDPDDLKSRILTNLVISNSKQTKVKFFLFKF